MKICAFVILLALFASVAEAIQPVYCLHQVYRLENEFREFDVYWIQIEPSRFLAIYSDPWKDRGPRDFSLDTHLSSLIDDQLWIGTRLHCLKYRIERWHRIKMDRAECWSDSSGNFWIMATNGRWILARQQKTGGFLARIVSQGPR